VLPADPIFTDGTLSKVKWCCTAVLFAGTHSTRPDIHFYISFVFSDRYSQLIASILLDFVRKLPRIDSSG
jgi:hypothetical protein